MTRTMPTGWQGLTSRLSGGGEQSPAPVGWQGLATFLSKVRGAVTAENAEEVEQAGEERESMAIEAGESTDSDEEDEHGVSRETNLAPARQEAIDAVQTTRESSNGTEVAQEVKGYDILLGSGEKPIVTSAQPFDGRADAGQSEHARASAPSQAQGSDQSTGEPERADSPFGVAPEGYVPRHSAPEPSVPTLVDNDDEPGPAKIQPDTALAANALPSRKSRRSKRPRVPAFNRVATDEWRDDETEYVTETPTSPSAEELAQAQRTAPEQLPKPGHPRVMTVANQKGGVGKTTTTVNVAAALAQGGLKVLVIDIDPQGNASTALGIDHDDDVPSVYDVIVDGTPLDDVMQECPQIPGLWCAPATIDLAGAEIELVSLVARESRLHRAINVSLASGIHEQFDYVFIDCPPSLGLLTVNAFVAADEVFIPIQCEYYALEGLSQLLKNIEMIKMHLNPGLHVSTILLTMYDGRTNLSSQVVEEVRSHFPDQVLPALVPRSVRISEAPSHGETVMTYDPASTGAHSYREASRDIAMRGSKTPEPTGRLGR